MWPSGAAHYGQTLSRTPTRQREYARRTSAFFQRLCNTLQCAFLARSYIHDSQIGTCRRLSSGRPVSLSSLMRPLQPPIDLWLDDKPMLSPSSFFLDWYCADAHWSCSSWLLTAVIHSPPSISEGPVTICMARLLPPLTGGVCDPLGRTWF